MDNPYFRLPIGFDPHKFYGSAHWVQFVLEEITAVTPRDIELIGLPGMAKTTLLRYLAHPAGAIAQHPEWLQSGFAQAPARLFPILVEFRLLPPGVHPFTYLYGRLLEEYAVYRPPAAAALDTALPVLPPPGGPAVDSSVDAIDAAIRELSQAGVRPMLLLDDFDLAFGQLTVEQATRLRPWRDQVSFVLVTERPLHEVNARAIGSPFFQTLPLIRMGGLTEAEARRVLTEPAAQEGTPFPPADVEFLREQADGHPYLLFLAGRALWETRERLGLLDQAAAPLAGEPCRVLLGRLRTDFRRTFQLYYDRLDAAERHALQALIAPTPLDDNDYVALASLEEMGLVQSHLTQGYGPFSPLFADFLRSAEALPAPAEPRPEPARPEPVLAGLEAGLYAYLRRHHDQICTFEDLWQEVWGQPVPAPPAGHDLIRRRTQVTVSRLRKRLQSSTGEDISSVRDQGYRLAPARK